MLVIQLGSMCGGSVVTSRWVITTPHCLINFTIGGLISPNEINVMLGYHDVSPPFPFVGPSSSEPHRLRVEVSDMFVHPSFYRMFPFDNDIALLYLGESVDTKVYTPVCLPQPEDVNVLIEGRKSLLVGEWSGINIKC